jgi:hypothetical protein
MEAGVIGLLSQLVLQLVEVALKHAKEPAPILSLEMEDFHALEILQRQWAAIFKHAA